MKTLTISCLILILLTSELYSQWYSQIPVSVNSNFQYLQFVDYNTGWAIAEDHKLFKSTDGGSNWVDMGNILPGVDIITSVYFLNPSTGWLATYSIGDSGNVYKTNDGGLSWFLQSGYYSYIYINDIWFADSMTGYMAAMGGLSSGFIYKSTDGGDSWVLLVGSGIAVISTSVPLFK